jgi:hydrogenase maturation factor
MAMLVISVEVQVRRHVIAVCDLLDGKELAFDTTHHTGGPVIFEAEQSGVVQCNHVATDIALASIRPDPP